jgi:excisionase family DNA binding protein
MSIALKEDSVQLLTVREVAKILRLSVGAVRNLIVQKEIPALRLGKQYRIPKYVIDNLLTPLLGESVESLGFGIWRSETEDSARYVRKIRKREESKSLDAILDELRQWEKTSSSTPTS